MKVITKTLLSISGVSGLLAVLTLALTLVAPVRAQEYITIPTPEGTTFSTAWGINARGDIVGTFVKGGVQRGFLLSKDGKFTVIEFPNARLTIARGINPSGEIVGSYQLPGDPGLAARGFLLTKRGEFFNVRVPEHTWEIAQRILPNGTIVGCRHDQDQMATMRGLTIGKNGVSEIDAYGSMQNGATPDLRLLIGFWFNEMDNQTQGYMIENGVFTSFMVPGSTGTGAWDVNPDGAIVGVYNIGPAFTRGFLKIGETYAIIHYPGSTATRAFGINARGDIVGNYTQGGVTRAFLAHVVNE